MAFLENRRARQFAAAFLNCYRHDLPEIYFKELEQFACFMEGKRLLYAYFHLIKQGTELIDLLVQKIHPEAGAAQYVHYTKKIIELLIKQKSLNLLGEIFNQIVLQHRVQTGKMQLTVFSPDTLSEKIQEALNQHLRNNIGNQCVIYYKQDRSLIKGLRIQSNTLLWEHSVKKQIRTLNNVLLLRMLL